MEEAAKIIGYGLVGFAIAALIAALMGLPTMWLWNWLMPSIFGLKTITFFEALGLNLLSAILVKSHSSSSSK